MLRREAVGEGHIELLQRLHLPVEPRVRSRPEAVRPAQSSSKMFYPKAAQPLYRVIEPVIFEVKPLADSEFGHPLRKNMQRAFRVAVFPKQSHVEMPVIRRTFGFPVPGGGRPGTRQIVERIPVNSGNASGQQLGRSPEAEFLDLLRAEAGNADF